MRTGHIADLRARIGTDLLLQPAASACILDERRHVLVARHATDGRWSLPGGAVEPFEAPADAIVREVAEELGVEVRPWAVVAVTGGPGAVIDYPNGDRTAYVGTCFACEVVDGTPDADGVELLDLAWIDPLQPTDLPLSDWMDMLLPLLRTWLDTGTTGFATRSGPAEAP